MDYGYFVFLSDYSFRAVRAADGTEAALAVAGRFLVRCPGSDPSDQPCCDFLEPAVYRRGRNVYGGIFSVIHLSGELCVLESGVNHGGPGHVEHDLYLMAGVRLRCLGVYVDVLVVTPGDDVGSSVDGPQRVAAVLPTWSV